MAKRDGSNPNPNCLMDLSDHVDLTEKSEEFKKLVEYGLNPKVVGKLEEIFKTGKLLYSELDERALDALKEFPVEGANDVLRQFLDSSLEHVSNKSAFLCGVMKTYRQKMKVPANANASSNASANASATNKGPDEEKIKAILDRTGYTLDVTTGQRKYGGPPPNWTGSPPGPGCEIFVGKIPKDIFEDELIPLFERCGPLWDLRLMMDPLTGQNRGYAFITYKTRQGAQNAVKQLDNHEIRKGKFIGVTVSINNHRLFVGNIPKNRGKEELLEEFSKHAPGLVEVIIYSSPDDKKKNRGFCFLEYDSHKAASLAKRRLSTGRIKVWGCDIIVDWADPQEEPDEETMAKVKVLYARNLTSEVTEERLRELFEGAAGGARVERVKKIKDYAFVHFEEREAAVEAMRQLDGREVGGAPLQVSLAKPPSDKKKKEEILRNRERRMMQMMQQRAMMMGIPPPPPRGRGARLPLPAAARSYDYDYDYYGYGDYQGGYGGGSDPYYEDYYGGRYDDYYDYGYRARDPPLPLAAAAARAARAGPERGRAGRGIPRGRGASGPLTPRGGARGPPVPPLGRGRGPPLPPGVPPLPHLGGPPLPPRGSLVGKRKFDAPPPHHQGGAADATKRRFQNSAGGGGQWGSHPIAQQPLNSSGGYNGFRRGQGNHPAHWYQDSYGQQWG